MTDAPLPTFQVANAHFVTDQLLIGGDLHWDTRIAVAQLGELVEAGVTHIVDTRIEADDEDLISTYSETLKIELDYLHRGIDDAGEPVPREWFDACAGHALDAIESGGVVLTHCHMGINRGPSLGYAVLLAQGWDPVDALARVVEVRSIVYAAYAEDALVWHHAKVGTPPDQCGRDLERLAQWRRDNDLELVEVLRLKRPVEPPTWT